MSDDIRQDASGARLGSAEIAAQMFFEQAEEVNGRSVGEEEAGGEEVPAQSNRQATPARNCRPGGKARSVNPPSARARGRARLLFPAKAEPRRTNPLGAVFECLGADRRRGGRRARTGPSRSAGWRKKIYKPLIGKTGTRRAWIQWVARIARAWRQSRLGRRAPAMGVRRIGRT